MVRTVAAVLAIPFCASSCQKPSRERVVKAEPRTRQSTEPCHVIAQRENSGVQHSAGVIHKQLVLVTSL
jgi:hypothetical protein